MMRDFSNNGIEHTFVIVSAHLNNGNAVRDDDDDDDDMGVHVSWPRPENLSQNSLFFLTEASITALLVASLDELVQDTHCAGQRTKRTKQDEEQWSTVLCCPISAPLGWAISHPTNLWRRRVYNIWYCWMVGGGYMTYMVQLVGLA